MVPIPFPPPEPVGYTITWVTITLTVIAVVCALWTGAVILGMSPRRVTEKSTVISLAGPFVITVVALFASIAALAISVEHEKNQAQERQDAWWDEHTKALDEASDELEDAYGVTFPGQRGSVPGYAQGEQDTTVIFPDGHTEECVITSDTQYLTLTCPNPLPRTP